MGEQQAGRGSGLIAVFVAICAIATLSVLLSSLWPATSTAVAPSNLEYPATRGHAFPEIITHYEPMGRTTTRTLRLDELEVVHRSESVSSIGVWVGDGDIARGSVSATLMAAGQYMRVPANPPAMIEIDGSRSHCLRPWWKRDDYKWERNIDLWTLPVEIPLADFVKASTAKDVRLIIYGVEAKLSDQQRDAWREFAALMNPAAAEDARR